MLANIHKETRPVHIQRALPSTNGYVSKIAVLAIVKVEVVIIVASAIVAGAFQVLYGDISQCTRG